MAHHVRDDQLALALHGQRVLRAQNDLCTAHRDLGLLCDALRQQPGVATGQRESGTSGRLMLMQAMAERVVQGRAALRASVDSYLAESSGLVEDARALHRRIALANPPPPPPPPSSFSPVAAALPLSARPLPFSPLRIPPASKEQPPGT